MPLSHLSEFIEIVEGGWSDGPDMPRKPSEDEMQKALQMLLTRQCVYADMPNLGRMYEVLKHYASFVNRFFQALGYELYVSNSEQMIALRVPMGRSRYDTVFERMKKDEILVLMAMALMREEAISHQEVGDYGRVETTTGDLIDRLKTVTQQDPPDESRLNEILREFSRKGAVRLGERDRVERVTPILILPGVSIIAPDQFMENLKSWAASPPERDMPSAEAQ